MNRSAYHCNVSFYACDPVKYFFIFKKRRTTAKKKRLTSTMGKEAVGEYLDYATVHGMGRIKNTPYKVR